LEEPPMIVRAHSRVADFRRGKARYVPTARIAAGGMAEVWRGQAHFPDGHIQPVAIKRVLPMLASNSLYRRMLEDEARIGMLLRHDNIVRVFDARESRGCFILIMELVEGPPLRSLLGRLSRQGGGLPVRAALHIARDVARALAYAHEAIDEWGRDLNIVHRDVSPHNVLIGEDGKVSLMDFGLANSSTNLADRDPGMIGGKFGYLSPELILEQRSSHLLDLFALGVVLWECLTGSRLFQGKDDDETVRKVARCQVPAASSMNPRVPAELDQVLGALLARDPSARYQSARELIEDLDYMLSLLDDGRTDPAAELVQAVSVLTGRSAPLQAGPLTGTIAGLSRSAVSQSGTRSIATALVEELEGLDDEAAVPLPSWTPAG
jgi:serine/threonine protein kinase